MKQATRVSAAAHVFLALVVCILGMPVRASAVVIVPTFSASITTLSNAAQWETAINAAISEIDADFTNPITIHITFQSNPGTSIFGRSAASGVFLSGGYTAMKNLLTANAHSPNDKIAVAHLPAADPTNGANFLLMDALAQALGQLPANYSGTDGTVTIGTGYSWDFNPQNRAVPGEYDFIGIAEHEISEVMGRYGTYNLGGNYGPLDLFGYAFSDGPGSGVLNLAADQSNNYFCIDGGQTALKLYNDAANGEDDKDWASGTDDSFNAFSNSGVQNGVSAIDVEEMNVIGYQVAVPEPSSLCTLGLGSFALLLRGVRRPKRVPVDFANPQFRPHSTAQEHPRTTFLAPHAWRR